MESRWLELVFATMTDAVMVADHHTGEVACNPAARALLGLGADELVTTHALEVRLGFYPFELIAGGDGPVREEVRIGDAVLHSVVTPLTDAGAVVGAVVVLRDLAGGRDLARRHGELVRVMTHELRTPLTAIAGALDIVLSGYADPVTDKQRRYVDMARQAATRMSLAIDQIADTARTAGPLDEIRAPLAIGRLTRDVVGRYVDRALARGVAIEIIATATEVTILGDPEQLARVLGNLLSNAIKFAAPGGRIDVEVFGPPTVADAVGVSVWNDGEPIPEAERERVFTAPDAHGRRVVGTGLGLGTSRAIIEAHGGRIWVESSAAGTKFVFTLPAASSATLDALPPLEPPPRAVAADAARVLVVDDDPHSAYLQKGLLMAAGHQVVVAADADAAMAAVRAEPIALVVVAATVDDATALIAILGHAPETRRTAVLGVGDGGGAADLLGAGADEYLARPIQPANFHEVCARLLADAGRQEAPRVLVVDDDTSVRAICHEILGQAGYTVRELGSAELAPVEARRFRPDLILLDVMMPVIDGFRTAERLRGDPVTALTPIIFLSAKGETADKVRAFRSGAEDYVVKPFDAVELVARVGKALARSARERNASPSTLLPGGDAVAEEVERRLAQGDHGCVCCYIDLDNFKAFNDYFGVARADAVIRQTGDLIREAVRVHGGPGDFIGHIAGDDFVMVVDGARVDHLCHEFLTRFDRLIPLYYDRAERRRGSIEAQDRYGVMRHFPLMTVSIARRRAGPDVVVRRRRRRRRGRQEHRQGRAGLGLRPQRPGRAAAVARPLGRPRHQPASATWPHCGRLAMDRRRRPPHGQSGPPRNHGSDWSPATIARPGSVLGKAERTQRNGAVKLTDLTSR
ncbi:MAG: response regulator [Myxococcales bacterium]|nr:response regulator [Myxococcales bacterium]